MSYDSIGSIGSDRGRFDELIAAGGRVIEYNPIAPWRRRFRFGWVSQRDHRKIVVIDSRVAFIGGLNIGAPWAAAVASMSSSAAKCAWRLGGPAGMPSTTSQQRASARGAAGRR